MEVKINKEIRDYRESLFMGLTVRQCLCGGAAIAVTAAARLVIAPALGGEAASWIGIFGAVPAAALGFFKYHGMTAEKAALAFIKSQFFGAGERLYRCENHLYTLINDRPKKKAVGAAKKGRTNP
jgi:hypothetical protein